MNPKPLQIAFEKFLMDRDEAALLATVREHGGRPPPEKLREPFVHRICDIPLKGEAYRVARAYHRDDDTVEIFIFPTKTPGFDVPGVPYALKGDGLRKWIEDELPRRRMNVDWSQYGVEPPTA
jgi:hypothetical protein